MAMEADTGGALSDSDCKALCLEFADLEVRLQEIDRARGIYIFASSLADPAHDRAFWDTWEKWRKKKGVDLFADSGRPVADSAGHDEL